jgi:MFS transporter, CP family, cyanate transporter
MNPPPSGGQEGLVAARGEVVTAQNLALALALLWLAGNALRLPILAVPPVLNIMQAELAMSGTQVGILSGLPVILFAVAALPGSLMIARMGAAPALMIGLLIAALGSGLRLFVDTVAMLYAATIVMGAGIAVMQPALPAVVRQWAPQRIGLATAVFTNGLIIGEIIPVALMLPVVMPVAGGSWRTALAFWALPMAAIALLILLWRPRTSAPVSGAGPVRWWPDWRHPHVWRPGLILGSANGAYFGGNTFLPGYLSSVGQPELVGHALTALNLGQLPASLLLLVIATRIERRAWPFVALGVGTLVCLAGIVATAGAWTVAFAAGLGFCAAGTLVLSLTLPPLLRPPADVSPTSAAMFAIGYSQAMLMSVLGGAAWDLSGSAAFAFAAIAIGILPLLLLPATIRFERAPTL